jgi:hypothetical protein
LHHSVSDVPLDRQCNRAKPGGPVQRQCPAARPVTGSACCASPAIGRYGTRRDPAVRQPVLIPTLGFRRGPARRVRGPSRLSRPGVRVAFPGSSSVPHACPTPSFLAGHHRCHRSRPAAPRRCRSRSLPAMLQERWGAGGPTWAAKNVPARPPTGAQEARDPAVLGGR